MKDSIDFCSECGLNTVEDVQQCHEPDHDTEYY